ncbi:MAG: DsbA family protein, partial [Pseudomonadota bacterium]
ACFASDAIKAATSHDFDVSRQAGVKGFPTLIAGTPDQGFGLVTAGYTDAVTVSERIKAVREAA